MKAAALACLLLVAGAASANDDDGGPDAAYDAIAKELIVLRASLRDDVQAARSQSAGDALVTHAEETYATLRERNSARLDAFKNVTPKKRSRLLGLGDEGLTQLLHEVDHASVVGQFLWFIEVPALRSHLQSLPGLTVTRLSIYAFFLAATAATAVVTVRRGRRVLQASKVLAARLLGKSIITRGVIVVMSALEAVWGSAVVLVAVLIAGTILAPAREFAPVAIAYEIAFAWALLRLIVRCVHESIRWLARPQLGALSTELSAHAFSSVRFVGRYVFSLYVFVSASEAIVGRGYLYNVAVLLGVLLTVPVSLLVIRSWQDDISDTYLRLAPQGRLAATVTRTRKHWYGFFIVVAAFVFIASRAVVVVASRFVMRFDQTRKALAFVFRRRLEQHAKERPDDARPLPDAVVDALRIAPATGTEVLPYRLKNMTDVMDTLTRFQDASEEAPVLGAALVTGLPGVGKTSWLLALESKAKAKGLPVTMLTMTRRRSTEQVLVTRLAQAFAIDATDGPSLVAALRAGPKRLLIIDDLHHLWLRGDQDRHAWRAITALIDAVGDHVFVAASMSSWPYAHLAWAERHLPFRHVVELPPWTETEIHRLLLSRTQRCGIEVNYDDLIITHAEHEHREMQLLSTAREYTRLLWDFAEGSPAVALDAWRRSLRRDADDGLRVRLFQQPEADVLDALDDTGQFALASVLWNDVVTADDAAVSLRLPKTAVTDALRRLCEAGVLHEAKTGYRLHVRWWSTAARFLRRKHLIAED